MSEKSVFSNPLTRVHGFATKTNALAREVLTQNRRQKHTKKTLIF